MEAVFNNNKQIKSARNSAFEILRIIAIILIIAHHFGYYGGFDFSGFENTSLILINKTWIDLLMQIARVGVNLFVLISAFFLAENNKFKIKKIIYLIFEILFFSITLGIVFLIINGKEFNFTTFKSIFFPLGSDVWWFMTSYLLLYVFSPFLNLGIRAMNKKMHLFLIILFMLIWSFLPTFLTLNYAFSIFGWFLTLYLTASYIKIYDVNIKVKPYLGIIISIGIFLLWFFFRFLLINYYQGDNHFVNDILKRWVDLRSDNSFVQVAATIVMFLSFKKMKVRNIKAINIIASTTLAIYLVHEQADMRNLLWVNIFKNASYASSPYLIPYTIGVTLAVFACGVLIGLAHQYSIGLLSNKFLSFLDEKYLYKIDKIFNNNP